MLNPQWSPISPSRDWKTYQFPSDGRKTERSVLPSPSKSARARTGAATPEIVKFASETSKKIFPVALTITLAEVVLTIGIFTTALPLFGTAEASTVGNVVPPSVESSMSRFEAFTGAAFVPATFHEMVCDELPWYVTFVLGDVTAKGPLFPSTLTVTAAVFIPPPPA